MSPAPQDITVRQQAEQTIRFQANLLNAVEQAVIAVDLTGQIIYYSQDLRSHPETKFLIKT